MYRISKLIYIVLIVVLAIWLIPWTYDFFTLKSESVPFTLYSEVADDFVMRGSKDLDLPFTDLAGNEYTQREFDLLLPLFYVRQLTSDARFPAEIKGKPITPHQAQTGNFVFRSIPSELNRPTVDLHFLLESMSGRVELTMPDDIFRLTSTGIQFLDMDHNKLKVEKSERFTVAMKSKGFEFPAKLIAGNPTTRKDYDEGYLIVDANNKLFHLKQTVGRPYVRAIALPEGLQLAQMFVTEFRSKLTLGLLVDKNHKLYALETESYKVKSVDIPQFNPLDEVMTIFGNLMHWTIKIEHEDQIRFYAVDATNYQLLKSHTFTASNEGFFTRWRSVLMPLRLAFTSPRDKYVYPRFNL